ncbi:hypothetical protein TrST_g3885 [Triparma strigata]|uniref:U3 small nucleolar RNA-associated protein 14 n=1 Tax=Triparma strigata TaxID=1606541 RepID=A0A9W7ET84_9STRA|nr:hypothetical protein TrST_g3885 [Triparma strigata]
MPRTKAQKSSNKSSNKQAKKPTDFSKIKTADEYNQEYLDNSEDESEIDSDDAFDEEDEKKYGSLFANNDDDDDDSSDDDDDSSVNSGASYDSDSDSEEEEVDMLAALDNLPTSSKSNTRKSLSTSHASLPESRFSSQTNSSTLTMDALLNPVSSAPNYTTLRNTTSKIDATKSASSRLSDVVLDRAKRKVNYSSTKSDISNWTDAVKMNREAETLDFRPKGRERVTTNTLSSTFEAANDFEKKIEAALQKQKSLEDSEHPGSFDSDDDLGHNKNLTISEVKKRHSELAKIRSLLFYEESKRHRLNKIKSKKYRKIRKKKSDREKSKELDLLAETDPSKLLEAEEKDAVKRMEERMSLQHRNTSKWARKQLRRGNIDTDTRRMLSEQIAISDKLRAKKDGIDEGTSSDSEDLEAVAREVINDTQGDGDEVEGRGLFKLDFMKRGMETQRKRAREEAEGILREIEEEEEWKRREEGGEESEGGESEGEEDQKEERVGREEAKRILDEGIERETRVGEGITIDISDSDSEDEAASSKMDKVENNKVTKKVSTRAEKAKEKDDLKKKQKEGAFETEDNPWMQQKQPSKKGSKKVASHSVVDVDAGVALMIDKTKVDVTGSTSDSENSESEDVTTLTQKQLVKRAFAGAKDARKDFEREKKALADRDSGKKEDDTEVKGWGSWTGVGVKPPSKKKRKKGKLAPPSKEPEKVKREDAKMPTVILNEKRHKKSSQFKVTTVPYPYTSAEQYERAMAGPIGSDWQTTKAVIEGTRPEIITRAGRIIDPAGKRMKRKIMEEKGGRRKFRA